MVIGKMKYIIDRQAFSIGTLGGESDEKSFWKSKTPIERLEAMEIMRQINYGYNPASERLQRFFEITELKRSST